MIMAHRIRRRLSAFGLWTFAGLAYAGAQYVGLVEAGRQWSPPGPLPALWPSVVWSVTAFYLWAALWPLISSFARRFPVEGSRRWRNLSFHVPAAAFFILLHASIWSTLRWNFFYPSLENVRSPLDIFRLQLTSGLLSKIMTYIMILVIIHALKYYREFVVEQLKASEMRAHLASVELQALKAQLHPHFLFNTINAVTELVYDSPAIADRVLAQLSALLRLSLKSGKEDEVPLKDELDFLRKYVEIQQTLLQERLVVNFRIDSSALDARVPNMILQPLVENAIRHGIAPREEGGKVEVEAQRHNGTLHVRVCDDGFGIAGAAADGNGTEGKGIGLANTRARLEHLYSDGHRFELTETPGGGLTVEIVIPFREDAEKFEGKHDDEDSHARS